MIDTEPPRRAVSSRRRVVEVVLFVLIACTALLLYLNSPSAVEIASASLDSGGDVTAVVDTCGYDLSISVDEIDSLVSIEVFDNHFRMRFNSGDCRRVIRIPLSGPLGGRLLIDGSTGRTLLEARS